MKGLILIIVVLTCMAASLVVVVAVGSRSNDLHWKAYKSKYNKRYISEDEDSIRKRIFLENRQKIVRHNAELASKLGYRLDINHLADRTAIELGRSRIAQRDLERMRAKRDSIKLQEKPEFLKKMLEVDVKDLPKKVDWRKVAGRVGPVKDQGQCLGDFAFATTGLLEGQQFRFDMSQQVIPLSDQNLLDCSGSNFGCQGSFVNDALTDMVAAGGIQSEHDYPYVVHDKRRDDQKCSFNVSKSVMTVKGSQLLDETEETLMKVVAQFGPVATGMDRTDKLIYYSCGVFVDSTCSNNPAAMTQTVLVVGYGHDEFGGDYWLVKNHWGTSFGDNGYFKIARNRDNQCGIANYATIPIM